MNTRCVCGELLTTGHICNFGRYQTVTQPAPETPRASIESATVMYVEKSAYDAIVKERDAFEQKGKDLCVLSGNSLMRIAELERELDKTKEALRLTGEGRPSEWAYTQLLGDYNTVVNELLVEREASAILLTNRDLMFETMSKRIAELEASECLPFDAYYKTCEVMNGQLEARIKEVEFELATEKVLREHAPVFEDLRVMEMQEKIAELEAKLKSVLPCFCKQIK